jgi:DNA-binding MarR family transcriptional regulator
MAKEMEELYYELFEAAGQGRRVGEEIAGSEGQTQSRWQTLWTIDAGGALTVPQIARRLGVSRQNEQRVVTELVEEGLAELVPNPDHKTSPLVRLTAEGNRVLDSINRRGDDSHQAIMQSFPAARVEELRRLLRDFTAATSRAHGTTTTG